MITPGELEMSRIHIAELRCLFSYNLFEEYNGLILQDLDGKDGFGVVAVDPALERSCFHLAVTSTQGSALA